MKTSTILSIFIGLLFAFIVYKLLYPTKVVSSGSSSANTDGAPTIVTPPTIVSNPSTVIAGTSVTFSASNITGVCHWFKNGSVVAEGQFLTIANPTATDIYTAKNFFNNIYSEASVGITVGTVTVTVSPPTIVSNPVNVIAGTPVTFTATIAAGINQWLKNGVYLQDGLTLTVANPTATDIYTSKCYSQNTYSVASNAITVQAIATVTVPTLTANPVNVIAGSPVTFTAGSVVGTHKFYKNGTFLQDGNTLTVASPTVNDIYTGKNFDNNIFSNASAGITVQAIQSNIVITEPNKPALFFSNNQVATHYDNVNNLPAIIQNTAGYDPVNDIVWMNNGIIKVGINLKRSGQIAWLSDFNSNVNLVQNGYDGGRSINFDSYEREDGFTINGEESRRVASDPTTRSSYNVILGGSRVNKAATLIDYKRIVDSYFVKSRPLFYTFDGEISKTTIAVTYTLLERSVKMDVTYTSFRDDGQWNGGGFDAVSFPACFIVDTLNRYKSYTGNNPWTNDTVNSGQIPIQNQGGAVLGQQLTENWVMCHKPDDSVAVGICTPNGGGSIYSQIKQLEVYNGNPAGTEFTGGFTYMDTSIDYTGISASRGNYSKSMTSFLSTGTPVQVQAEFNRLHSLGLV